MNLHLTKGHCATVDANDPKMPWRFKWYAQEDKKQDGTLRTVYAMRDDFSSGSRKVVIREAVACGESRKVGRMDKYAVRGVVSQ
jgi:hypothetical protein